MHVVIKETSTIAEFKAEKREKMETFDKSVYQRHKEGIRYLDNWRTGKSMVGNGRQSVDRIRFWAMLAI